MKGETTDDNEGDEDLDILALVQDTPTICGNDAYNIRWWTVEIKNLPRLFFVMLPLYKARGEADPKFDYFDDHFEITYTFKARGANKIFRMLNLSEGIPVGYELAAEASLEESNVKDPQECHIMVQFPFKNGFSDRKHIRDKNQSWEIICFHEKVDAKKKHCLLSLILTFNIIVILSSQRLGKVNILKL